MNALSWFICIAFAWHLTAAEIVVPPDGTYEMRVTHQARLEPNADALKPILGTSNSLATSANRLARSRHERGSGR